jgi:paraquat-inducible protein A
MILAYAWLRIDRVEQGLVSTVPGPQPIGSTAAGATTLGGPRPSPIPAPGGPAAAGWTLRNFFLSFLIILATVFFVLGIVLPVIRFTTVYVWANEHSIATITYALYQKQEYFLCLVLFVFSILFPFLKLFYLLTLVTSPDLSPEFRTRSVSTMEWLGRYSMTDVMVLALMIFYVNSSGYTEATVLPGVYFFAASALMTMLAYGWANSAPSRQPRPLMVAAAKEKAA